MEQLKKIIRFAIFNVIRTETFLNKIFSLNVEKCVDFDVAQLVFFSCMNEYLLVGDVYFSVSVILHTIDFVILRIIVGIMLPITINSIA